MATQNRNQDQNINNTKRAGTEKPKGSSGRTTTTSPGGDFSAAKESEGFANHPHFGVDQENDESTRASELSSSDIATRLSAFTGINRDSINRVVKSAEANPWLSVGAVGAAGLFLGYAFSRGLSSSATSGQSIGGDSRFRETFDYDEYEDADVE